MKCPNCGNEISDSAKFCPFCGTKINEVEPEVKTEPQPAVEVKKPKKQLNKKTVYGIIGGCVALAVILIIALIAGRNIDMSKYVDVTYTGYDGYGTAEVSFDTEKFAKDNAGKLKKNKSTFDYSDLGVSDQEAVESLADSYISVNLDKTNGLSNGDKIKYTVDCGELSSYMKGKFKNIEGEKEVKDLEKASKKDLFKDLDVSFAGVNGKGKCIIDTEKFAEENNLSAYDIYDENIFKVSQTEDLSNGDKVTVTITDEAANALAQANGVVPKKASKKYTVKGLVSMAETAANFTDDQLSSFINQGTDEIKAELSDYDDLTFTSAEYKGNYFLLSKDKSALDSLEINDDGKIEGYYYDSYNCLGLLYEVKAHYSNEDYGEADITFYVLAKFSNVYLNADGNPEVADLTSCSLAEGYSEIDTGLKNSWDDSVTVYGSMMFDSVDAIKSDFVDGNAANYTAEENIKG